MKLDMDLVVTCFSSAHAVVVSELIRSGLAEALSEPSAERLEAYGEAFSKEQLIRRMGERLTYVAVYRQKIIGAIVLTPSASDSVVEAVIVAPEHRGEGIGALLVQTAEKRAGELGIKRIRISPELKDNGFFQRLDYRPSEVKHILEKILK